jgi:hypothetical protein
MRLGFAIALPGGVTSPDFGHRLDEYLQNTIVAVEEHRLHAQMNAEAWRFAILPVPAARIDTDGSGAIADAEQRAYVAGILRDLTITLDGERLRPRVVALRFPRMEEMRAGRGEVQLDFEAELPRGWRRRKLTIENRRESRISAYQVNCLVPQDSHIRITGQHRDYTQANYKLDFEDTGAFVGFAPGVRIRFVPATVLLSLRGMFPCRRRRCSTKPSGQTVQSKRPAYN